MAARMMTNTVKPWPDKPECLPEHKARPENKDQVSEPHSGPQFRLQ